MKNEREIVELLKQIRDRLPPPKPPLPQLTTLHPVLVPAKVRSKVEELVSIVPGNEYDVLCEAIKYYHLAIKGDVRIHGGLLGNIQNLHGSMTGTQEANPEQIKELAKALLLRLQKWKDGLAPCRNYDDAVHHLLQVVLVEYERYSMGVFPKK